MDWCMMKKVKGYLVWVLVFYTVLVTYFLVLSAWSDDLSVKKRQGDDKLINVLYQEERRHLRSFKDVVKSYGGMVGQKIREQFNGDSTGNSGGDTSENGRTGRRFKSTDVFMSEDGAYPKNANNNSNSNNSTGMLEQLENSSNDAGVDRPKFTVEVESWEEAIMGKAYFQQKNNNNNVNNNNSNGNSSNGDKKNDSNHNNNNPYNGNIFIEDTVPNTNMNRPGDNSLINKTKLNNISNTYNNNYTIKKKPVGLSGKLFKPAGVANKGSSNIYNDGTVTDFCDKIDAEEPHLCLSERVTLFHPNHVNITPSHMSFKPIGDLHIYSGFLDTRKKPASIRFMVIAPKGRDSVKGSGYWCAFNLPSVLSQRFYWNGAKEPISVKPDQATQLDYYAASVGHGKELQFYIMSCKVPQRHLPNLSQMDTNRIHLVAGSKKSPLLETVQERISVDVMNNLGLPWHEMIKRSSVLGEVFQMNNNNSNNSKNNIKLDANAHQNNVLSNNHDKNNNNNNANNNDDGLNNNLSSNSSSSGKLNIPNNNIAPSPPAILNRNSIVSCIAPISTTTLTVVQMVEFIELTLLLGSQHIVMYTIRVSDDLKDVLAMYRYKGLITVLPWSIPNPSSIWANGRDIALNDCLYRTMHRYEFALFHDMDEFFVPRNTPDLPSFINFLYLKAGMKRNRTSDIIFSSAYYSPPTKIQSQSLTTMAGYTKDVAKFSSLRSIHRTYFNQEHSLRMIRPVMAFRVGGGERKRTVFTISSRYAAVNHYSKCVGTTVPAKKDAKPVGVDCTATKADTHMWRMKDKLIKQAKENIRDLNSKRKVYR